LGCSAHVGQHVRLGLVHERRQLGHTRPSLVSHITPLFAGGSRVILGKRGADPGVGV
jgi:hypothetical protein